MSNPDYREEICPDCQATEGNRDSRLTSVGKDPLTDAMFVRVTWHHDTCPQYTADRILAEDSARQVKEQEAWAKEALPAAFDRLRKAAAAARDDAVAAPFAEALVALVAQQAEDLGRFVPAPRWAEILEQYFPPADEERSP